jgi:hypothetical protein
MNKAGPLLSVVDRSEMVGMVPSFVDSASKIGMGATRRYSGVHVSQPVEEKNQKNQAH